MEQTKKETKECSHIYRLQRIGTEQIPEGGGFTGFSYKKVGYVVCEKCGYIIKQDL